MKQVLADFHVHTLLSPCAEVEMTPHHIVLRAAQFGIGAVAVTDHNSSANVPAAVAAGKRCGVKVFPGMEIECREEAHIVALFDDLGQLEAWQAIVDGKMSGLKNDSERLGAQFVVDSDDNFIREEERMLHGPLLMSAEEAVAQVAGLGGITVAAHVDRPSYSIIGQLGFIDPDMGFAAAEISRFGWKQGAHASLQRLAGYLPWLTDSDAHNIMDFVRGPKNLLTVEELTVNELKLALASRNGRRCEPWKFAEYE